MINRQRRGRSSVSQMAMSLTVPFMLQALSTMSLPIFPALSGAFTVFGFILASIQAVKANRNQLDVLTASTQRLLATLNDEFSELRLAPRKCMKALSDLEMCVSLFYFFSIIMDLQVTSGYPSFRGD